MPRPDGSPVPVHMLRPNDKVWSPPSVVVLDTETDARIQGDLEILELRLWVAKGVDRTDRKHRTPAVEWGSGPDAEGLAQWLTARSAGRNTLWVFAHNLNFDLVTTRLPMLMASLGWSVSDFSVRSAGPWLRLTRSSAVITVVDSWSWLPESLGTIEGLVNLSKVPLPANGGPQEEWLARCTTDVEITAKAILELMDWWDRNRLGRWTITGAGCGWNAMRHRPQKHRPIINPDPALVAQDRLAVRGGRKDAQRYGEVDGGPFVELDLVGAYPTVAKFLPLPTARMWTFADGDIDLKWVRSHRFGVIAEVEVEVDEPTYPVHHGEVNWFPVGRFRTALAGAELRQAVEAGHVRRIFDGQVHKLGFHLQPWAAWVLDVSSGGVDDAPPVARLAAKSWGRSVLGKWAARGHTSERLGPAPTADWAILDGWAHQAQRPGAIVDMAGQRWAVTYDGDTDNAYPAVLAFVEAEVRTRLGGVLHALHQSWVSCDTDGVIVDLGRIAANGAPAGRQGRAHHQDPQAVAQAVCDRLNAEVVPLVLRPKQFYDSADLWGPQHLVLGGERRLSGVRKDATQVGERSFKSREWPKLGWQIKHGQMGGYVRPGREMTLQGPLVHRWVTADGTVRPVEMTVGANGRNRMLSWYEGRWAGDGDRLADLQYRGLAGLY